MNVLQLGVFWMGALLLAQAGEGPKAGAEPKRPQPSYVVIAVDVSGSMDSSDKAFPARREALGDPSVGSAARGLTLRQEGQSIFLQLLPFLQSDLYVGVTYFSNRVEYSLPSRETGPLLPWGQTFLGESACLNLVKPPELQVNWRSDMVPGMNWAAERIQAARKRYGMGPAKLILLTKGDSRDSTREMERGRGPLLTAARQFAEQQIQIYPILLEDTSSRSGGWLFGNRDGAVAVEALLSSIAQMTGGKSYQLTPQLGFADILLDVFNLGTQVRGDLLVSRHDWAIVAVGTPLDAVVVTPPDGAGLHTLALDDRLEATTGIRISSIGPAGSCATILRRPGAGALLDRFWQGRWQLGSPEEKVRPALRLYRIPDYLMQLEMTPGLPWWLNEQVRIRAHLLDRHPEASIPAGVEPAEEVEGLSIHLRGTLAEGAGSFIADQGRWTTPGRLFETESFTIRTAGLYRLAGDLWHTVGDTNTPVLHFASDVYVHPECVGLEVLDAATDKVLQIVPAMATQFQIDAQGGQQVYFRVSSRGDSKAEPLSGIVRLEPLFRSATAVPAPSGGPQATSSEQTQWVLHKDEQGRLVAGPIRLAEQQERLTGSAELEVRTFAGVRHVSLPVFELNYTPAPTRVECTFTDSRDALWVGELHRQPLTITAFPVFERFREQALGLFPENLVGAHLRTIDLRSGTTQEIAPQNRLLERPQPDGPAGRTIAATYFVESAVPIPPCDKCEIDLSQVVDHLQGAVKTYAVVDPVAKGLFEWIVGQQDAGQRQGSVSETLYCGEPILLFAQWRPDQNVSAVRFEIPQQNPADSIFVDMPVTAGSNRTQLQYTLPGLTPGQVFPVYIHVTMQPAPARQPAHVTLQGGQFRAADRRIVLADLTVGDGRPADLPGYVWEPIEIPLQAVFHGYKPEDPAHNAALEQFKKSCAVTVTTVRVSGTQSQDVASGTARNLAGSIEWTAMTPAEGAARASRLVGRVTYTPEAPGRVAIEFSAQPPQWRGAAEQAPRQAYVHVLVKEPRVAIAINRLKPGGEEPLFDSRAWLRGQGGGTPLDTRLSTRLRVDLQTLNWAATGQSRPWQASLRLLRRLTPSADWTTVFSDTGELTASQSFTREVQIADNGQYALEVVGQDRQSSHPTIHVLTPVIAAIQPHEVRPTLTPPTWLTNRVRQWPFAYVVTLHQDATDLGRPQALAFQFQLPGQSDTWLDGATSPAGPQEGPTRQLSARAPRFLPAAASLRDGVAHFRLSAQGLEVLRWECPNIRVIPPVLEGLTLGRDSVGAALASAGEGLALDGSADLWVRPRFRVAPELEGQWTPGKIVIYLWRHPPEDAAGKPVDLSMVERLQERGKPQTAALQIKTFELANQADAKAVRVLPQRMPRGFWGWPRRTVHERYALVASVVYEPVRAPGGENMPASNLGQHAPTTAEPSETLPTVVEWSDIYPIRLDAAWAVPMCWWPLAAVLVMAVVTMVLRVLVPSPSRLALDMRLEEPVAVVEPVRLDNPVLVDLRETSLAEELVLYSRYLYSRWDNLGHRLAGQAGLRENSTFGLVLRRSFRGLAVVVAPVWVLLRRSLYPRRWAWAAVIPRIRGNAALVRTGLLCVWTGLGTRRGRVWSSQAGSLTLPEEGQVRSISLDLPYRIDSVDRTMRVTVRVRRMMAEELRTAVAT